MVIDGLNLSFLFNVNNSNNIFKKKSPERLLSRGLIMGALIIMFAFTDHV